MSIETQKKHSELMSGIVSTPSYIGESDVTKTIEQVQLIKTTDKTQKEKETFAVSKDEATDVAHFSEKTPTDYNAVKSTG